jgi:hypothetical protein
MEIMENKILEEKRKMRFVAGLDQMIQENIDCYIDELGNPIICPYTEETVYNWIMKNEEYRLLTSKYVKEMIHLFMTDFKARMKLLHEKRLA